MVNLASILRSTGKNFRHWITSPRIYIVWIMMFIFNWYAFHDYGTIAAALGEPVSLCAFVFLAGEGPILLGPAAMLLYSEAPFVDRHAAFLVIRTGRRSWIFGQVLYVFLSSFLYILGSYLTSVLVMLPHVQLEFDWGKLMWTIAQNPDLVAEIQATAYLPNLAIMNTMSGGKALCITLLMYWLVVAFLGIVTLCFNILLGKGSGTIFVALFTCLAIFSEGMAELYDASWHWIYKVFDKVAWFSPMTWRLLSRLIKDSPPLWYALSILIGGIVIMTVLAIIKFCKKDLEFERGEY